MATFDDHAPTTTPSTALTAAWQDPGITDTASSPKWVDFILVMYVITFAFLLASFPARNSDLWMHLAAGRELAHGRSPTELLRAGASDSSVQQAWLYDLLSYAVYSVVGGPGLVLVKVVLVLGLAFVLLQLSRIGPGWWIPTVSVALALLTMSTRLLLQPVTISYFMFTLTLFLAYRPDSISEDRRSSLPPLPIVILFVLWVNLDSWFVIGLGVLALLWLGRMLDESSLAGNKAGLLLGRAACLGLVAAACLLNPSHVRAFALPIESARVASMANLGQNPAGFAFYPLLGLGLLSFLLNLSHWRWQRFLPWVGLAVLSVLQVRIVPFFAVIAGPVLAWNLQEYFSHRYDSERQENTIWRSGAIAVRGLTLVLGLTFLVCAWPGWLQAPPYEPRRWAIETPLSLEQGAIVIRQWRQEGKLKPDARGLYLSRDTVSEFAWFCPEANGILDARVASALRSELGAPENWETLMRTQGINHLIVYDPDREHRSAILNRLLMEPEQWPLLDVEGDLAIFGWRDPICDPNADPFRGWEFDPKSQAFDAAKARKAPRHPLEPEPQERRFWDAFRKPAPQRPLDRDEATFHLLRSEALRQFAPYSHLAAWDAHQSAGLVSSASGWIGASSLLDAFTRLVLLSPQVPQQQSGAQAVPILDRMVLGLQQRFTFNRDDTSPALLYLAIRAARRAVFVNADDAQAYLILGQCYLRLLGSTRERTWSEQMPELAQLRRTQACAALNQALAINPDLAQAHLSLGALYRQIGYLDLALKHLQAYARLVHGAKLSSESDSALQSNDQAARFRLELDHLAKHVEELMNSYARESAGLKLLDRALIAMDKGLAGKARDQLLESDIAAFGLQGMTLEVELLLRTGRIREVLEWVDPEQKSTLGVGPYHWLRIQALAAMGDYGLAEEECALLGSQGRSQEPQHRELMAVVVGQAVLDEWSLSAAVPSLAWRAFRGAEFRQRISGIIHSIRQQANARVLAGLIALEEGEVDSAEVAFRLALAQWKDQSTAAAAGTVDFSGRAIAQSCLEWLQ